MFARLTTYDNVDVKLTDQMRAWLQASGADPFRELPGYQGSMTLLDRKNARLVGIGFYASTDDADQAGARVGALYERARDQIPEAIRPALEMQPESVGLYEIVHRD